MYFNSEQEIQQFVTSFQTNTLTKEQWTHEAHFVVGLWYLLHDSPATAFLKLRSDIKRNNESIGIPNTDTRGYHETITHFYVRVILGYIIECEIESVKVNHFNQIFQSPIIKKDYPLEFYSKELLFSVEARKKWQPPDIQKFM